MVDRRGLPPQIGEEEMGGGKWKSENKAPCLSAVT